MKKIDEDDAEIETRSKDDTTRCANGNCELEDRVPFLQHDSSPTLENDEEEWSNKVIVSLCRGRFQVTNGLCNTISIGIAFSLLFLAVNTTQWFESSLDAEWGQLALGLFYTMVTLSNLFFAADIVVHIGTKMAFLSSFIIYVLFVASHIRLYYWLLLVSSALCGVGAGVLWTAHGVYLSEVSTLATMGDLAGIFYSIFQFNSVLGNLLAGTIFTLGLNLTIFYVILSLVGCFSVAWMFWLVKYPPSRNNNLLSDSSTPTKISTLSLFRERVFQCVIPLFLGMGIHQGFCFAVWTRSITPLSLLGWVMVTFGVSNVMCSFLSGKLADRMKTPHQKLLLLFLALLGVLIGLLIFQFSLSNYQISSFFLTAICFGGSDAAARVFSYTILQILKPSHKESSFAFSLSIQSFSTAMTLFLATILESSWIVLLLATVYSLGFLFVSLAFYLQVIPSRSNLNHV